MGDFTDAEVYEAILVSTSALRSCAEFLHAHRCDERKYARVLRYKEHFVPFARALTEQVRGMTLPRRALAVRS